MATLMRKRPAGMPLGDLVDRVDRLVSLPDVYYRLESLIEQPASSLQDVARLLACEPDLCARLLRLANSAFYSFPRRIESIDQAVQVIGIRQIRELVLATSIADAFGGAPLGMMDMRAFWTHAVATGIMAKCLGRQAQRRHAERYYVAGLLHDIGRLALFLALPERMNALLLQREREECPLHRLEAGVLGYDHAETGAALLQRWRVPESIHEAVRWHHQPQLAMAYGEVASAVHLADIWVNGELQGNGDERFELVCRREAFEELGVEENDLSAAWRQAEPQLAAVARSFLRQ